LKKTPVTYITRNGKKKKKEGHNAKGEKKGINNLRQKTENELTERTWAMADSADFLELGK